MCSIPFSYQIPSLRMARTFAPKFLNDHILLGINKGYTEMQYEISDPSTYPNIAVPIAMITDYYQKNRDISIQACIPPEDSYMNHIHLDSPISATNCAPSEFGRPFDKIWLFDSSESVCQLVDACISALRETDELGIDIIISIEWCLNEAMDNVLQHSQAPYGFFMGQLQKTSHRLSVCIADWGIGIYNSLKPSIYNPQTPFDAITLAMQERVTRDIHIGQGNGLWGLTNIIKQNHGSIRIASGGAEYCFSGTTDRKKETGCLNLGEKNGMTLIDFQLDYSFPMNIAQALGGYQPTDLWLEEREISDDFLCFRAAQDSHGTGTRQAAQRFRSLILNTYRQTGKKVIIDFDGINLISSSYADELIGKIISEYGFLFFLQTFTLRNVSPPNRPIIDRSVGQRMAQKYYDENIPDIADETPAEQPPE